MRRKSKQGFFILSSEICSKFFGKDCYKITAVIVANVQFLKTGFLQPKVVSSLCEL